MKNTITRSLIFLIIMVGIGVFLHSQGISFMDMGNPIEIIENDFEDSILEDVERIQSKSQKNIALDSERQYEIAKKNGTAMDAYTRACLVAECYLQAKDEANYKKWKAIEKEEAKNAGFNSQ